MSAARAVIIGIDDERRPGCGRARTTQMPSTVPHRTETAIVSASPGDGTTEEGFVTDRSRDGGSPTWTHDRAHIWLPLLRDLMETIPEQVVVKGSHGALASVSDVDMYARRGSFPAIERRFRSWAADNGLQVVVVCRHDWRGPTMLAIRADDVHPFTLDVKVGRFFHGSFLYSANDLRDHSTVDGDGVRRMRQGAEATANLLVYGTTRSGRRNAAGFAAKDIEASLAADVSGAMAAARFAGAAAPALRRGIEQILAGSWSRREMATVIAWCYARAVARPDRVVRQLKWRFLDGPSCAVTRIVDRRIPDDRERWLLDVADSHPVSGFLGLSDGATGTVVGQVSGS